MEEDSDDRSKYVSGQMLPRFSQLLKSINLLRKYFLDTFTNEFIDQLYADSNFSSSKNHHQCLNISSMAEHLKQQKQSRQDGCICIDEKTHDFGRRKGRERVKSRQISLKDLQKSPMNIRTKKAKLQGLDYLRDTRKKKIVHELEAHWNDNHQKILVQLYKQRYHFSYIRDYFQSNYPTHKQLFTVLSVRSKLFKILRVGIRKIYYFIANSGEWLPQLLNLDDQRIKTIVYSQETLHLRILILCVYELRQFHYETVRQTIEAIDQYFLANHDQAETKRTKEKNNDIIFNSKGTKQNMSSKIHNKKTNKLQERKQLQND